MTPDDLREVLTPEFCDIYEAVNLETCVKSRVSEGGTSPESVKAQIRLLQESVLA